MRRIGLRITVLVMLIVTALLVISFFKGVITEKRGVNYSRGYYAFYHVGEGEIYIFFLPIDEKGTPINLIFAGSAVHDIYDAEHLVTSPLEGEQFVALIKKSFEAMSDKPYIMKFIKKSFEGNNIFFETNTISKNGYSFKFIYQGRREGKKIVGNITTISKYPFYSSIFNDTDYLEFMISEQ